MATASPAVACPVASDLRTGIVVTETDGTTNLFRDVGDNRIVQVGTYSDGIQFQHTLINGIHPIQISSLINGVVDFGSARVIEFSIPLDQLPLPQSGFAFAVDTTVQFTTDATYSDKQLHTWGSPSTFTIGDCIYDSIPGALRYKSAEKTVDETVVYLPELGIALLTRYADSDSYEVNHTYESIAAK